MPAASPCRALACAVGVLAGAVARAQGPEPTLAQLAHRAWTIRDGAPGAVNALAQTPDGYLWLGTGMGLYRFDGARFEPYEPPDGQALRSRVINMLHALPDGALWIGYSYGGASVLAGGRLVNYGPSEGLPPGTVNAFARDSAGTTWVATLGGLARLVGARWERVGPERGYPGGATADLLVDRRGVLWATELTGVYVLPRGARRFVRRAPPLTTGVDDPGGGALAQAPDGSIWGTSVALGPVPLSDSAGGPPPAGGRRRAGPGWREFLIDRQGNAWQLAHPGLFVRAPLRAMRGARASRTDLPERDTLVASRAAGMSGSNAVAGLEDREGSMWLGTEGGLDQFRAPKLTPVVWPRDMVDPIVVADDRGGVWAASAAGGPLMSIGGRVTEHPEMSGRVMSMSRDSDGGLWLGLGGPAGLRHGSGGRFTPVPLPPEARGVRVQALARDRGGTLWVSVTGAGVFRRRAGVWERFVTGREPSANTTALVIVADRAGRTWLGYRDGHLAVAAGDSVRIFSAPGAGEERGITALHVRGDTVWAGLEFGVARLAGLGGGARLAPFAVASGALHSVSGIVQTSGGELWLNSDEGVTRVRAAELRRALRDAAHRARDERFGPPDGLEGAAVHVRPLGTAVEGADGRLWFATQTSVAWVDPQRIRRNPLPPPVHVRALAAGGRRFAAAAGGAADTVRLPERTTAFSVAYAAPSLAVPERVRFRYRLVGLDTAWQDAGGRREAFYTNLAPGAYRFEALAANEDGVWSAAPAALAVVVPPAFAQTPAFRALCALAAGGALSALAQRRQRRATAAVRARYDAVLAERTRVARELHDTLLSDMTAVAMRLDAAATAPGAPAGVDVALVADVRDQARRAVAEARRAVVGLRASSDDAAPLWEQIEGAAWRAFADTDVAVHVERSGTPRRLPPPVEAEVVRIASEAMTNARKHAGCRTMVASCAYGRQALTLRLRDDGRGFDPARAAENGHFGLTGVRERAAAIGARLAIDSAPGRGTELRLVVPVPRAE